MVRILQNIFRKVIAGPEDKEGHRTRRCKGCGTGIEDKNDEAHEYADYCDECFAFIFARR